MFSFTERLKNEIGKDWLLDRVVETKNQRAEVAEINKLTKEIQALVKANENTIVDWRDPIRDPDQP